MTTFELLVLAWAVGAPALTAAFVFAYPAYLRKRRTRRDSPPRRAALRGPKRHSLRRTG